MVCSGGGACAPPGGGAEVPCVVGERGEGLLGWRVLLVVPGIIQQSSAKSEGGVPVSVRGDTDHVFPASACVVVLGFGDSGCEVAQDHLGDNVGELIFPYLVVAFEKVPRAPSVGAEEVGLFLIVVVDLGADEFGGVSQGLERPRGAAGWALGLGAIGS